MTKIYKIIEKLGSLSVRDALIFYSGMLIGLLSGLGDFIYYFGGVSNYIDYLKSLF